MSMSIIHFFIFVLFSHSSLIQTVLMLGIINGIGTGSIRSIDVGSISIADSY
jgi:hypothetical protein